MATRFGALAEESGIRLVGNPLFDDRVEMLDYLNVPVARTNFAYRFIHAVGIVVIINDLVALSYDSRMANVAVRNKLQYSPTDMDPIHHT
jgi:hypothetical protein